MRRLILLLAAQAVTAPADLGEKIEALIEASPAARRAFWGIHVVRLPSGEAVHGRNEGRLFVPASNTKLFTTALALEVLGPGHRFRTRVTAGRAPDDSGHVRGDLFLEGGGDPTLSAREIPYRAGPVTGDPLGPIEQLAEAVVARGVRRISGDIAGDDTAYVWAPYPEGWAQDDLVWQYGAPVSALSVNDNTLSIALRPAKAAGLPARIALSPPVEYYAIDNRVRTVEGSEAKVEVERSAGGRQLRLWGEIGVQSAGATHAVAVSDPALFAAAAFHEALTRRGVAITGKAVAVHKFPDDVPDPASGAPASAHERAVLAERESPPLVEVLRTVNKVSQNLHAELVLREVGRVRRNAGSREAGMEELRGFLRGAGIEEKEYELADGSGLSRRNVVSPAAVTKLLAHMYRSKHREEWLSLMPVGGTDGTLEHRFRGIPEGRRIRAKTGTVAHVSALSGYADSGRNGPLAFSILVNNYSTEDSEIRRIIDRISSWLVASGE